MRRGLLGAAVSASLLVSVAACAARTGPVSSRASTTAHAVRLYIRPVAKNAVNGQATVWNKQTSPDMFAPPAPPASSDPDVSAEPAKEIQEVLAIRQSPDVVVRLSQEEIQEIREMTASDPQGATKLIEQKFGALEKAVKSTDCSKPDPLAGKDDPKLPLVTCSQDGNEKLVLEPSIIDVGNVVDACAAFDRQRGSWVVNLSFDPRGREVWSKYTEGHIGTQTAITLDSRVVSHPVIQGRISGSTQIGGNFEERGAREFAKSLGGCHA